MPDSVISLFRSWRSRISGVQSGEQDGNRDFRHMYKPKSRKRRGQWDISELETHDLVSNANADIESRTDNRSVKGARSNARVLQVQTV